MEILTPSKLFPDQSPNFKNLQTNSNKPFDGAMKRKLERRTEPF
jgi:hypothetical protein